MDSPIAQYLRRLHAEISQVRHGEPYTLGPKGTVIDPDDFGICLVTADGYLYQAGLTGKPFSMQSLSKPFSYGLALADLGFPAVDAKVDVEPSGESFTEISLAPGTGRPANAMINAGALAVAGLIKGAGGKSAITRIEEHYSAFAGRDLRSDRRVYGAERRNSDRNHALAYLLSSFDIIEGSPTTALETYLRQCAIQITCRDLAMMAATLANGGLNPRTGAQALGIAEVERVLSVMMTSGMYDDAGDWMVTVGMPAKSGVGGGTLAVLPGQAGLAVFSPPLDRHGNSVRGVATCRRLSADTEMHFVRSARPGRSAIRARYPITQVPSDVRRTEEADEALRDHGHRAMVIELAGDLLFAGTESMIRKISALPDEVEHIVLDARRVGEVGSMCFTLLRQARKTLADAGRHLVLIDPEATLAEALPQDQVAVFATRSAAVAHCEEQLLSRYFPDLAVPDRVPVLKSPALAMMSAADTEALVARMQHRIYDDGTVLRRMGQRFDGVYFIVSGTVTTTARDAEGNRVRLATLSAGMTFGELTLGREERQQSTQRARGRVEVMVLTEEAIAQLEADDPRLAIELWRALTREAYTRVDQYLREVATLVRD